MAAHDLSAEEPAEKEPAARDAEAAEAVGAGAVGPEMPFEAFRPQARSASPGPDAPSPGAPLIRPSSTDHPLHESVVDACRTVFDPEIPVNVYDLGLVYTIEISPQSDVRVTMTLTAPGCPVAGEMPGWVAEAIEPLPGVRMVDVALTFDPPWGMEMMSDEARLELGFM